MRTRPLSSLIPVLVLAAVAFAGSLAAALQITTAKLPSATTGKLYSHTLTKSGGFAPFAWSVTPALPAGLSLTATTGLIAGLATAASAPTTYVFTLTGANSETASRHYQFGVYSTLTVTGLTFASSVALYSVTFDAAGGSGGPYAWSVNPALPAGMSLNTATGELSGPVAGSYQPSIHTLTVSDGTGATGQFGVELFPVVTVADVQRVVTLVLGVSQAYPSEGDLNFDGQVNVNDIQALVNYILHTTASPFLVRR